MVSFIEDFSSPGKTRLESFEESARLPRQLCTQENDAVRNFCKKLSLKLFERCLGLGHRATCSAVGYRHLGYSFF
jgi:hypothetical protein